MLDPERKQHIADGTEYISSLLHEELVKIVAEAIVTRMERGVDYRLTARDRWMLELLQDAGYMREALEKEIADKTRLMLREVQAAFEDAAVESVAWDNDVYLAAGLEPLPLRQSPTLMRLAERGYQKTKGELVNFTGTMASASQQLFIRECDKAYTLVASGAMGHAQAVRQAVETAAGDGVIVRYPSGHRDTIETATGRAVRTGVGQACGDMTLARMDEMDWDIVLVSSHLGARTGDGGDNWTNHYYLQSLGFFSRSGSSKKFKALSVCGIGYVDGLLGANCRHSIGPGDGVHNPYTHYDSEENRLREELEQRQRLLERRVRDTKRKVQGLKAAMDKAEDPADREELRGRYQQTARKLQQQNRDYNEFCEANELKQYRERLHIAGWDRKQAASATGAARAAEKAAEAEKEKALANSRKSDIMEVSEGIDMGVDIGIDKFTPCLENTSTGEIVETTYSLASRDELKGLQKKGWAFNWSAADLKNAEIYKLNVKGTSEIQGLIAITPQERDKAMYVNIVESAPHNKGKDKQYYGVGGHLFAIAAQKSMEKGYGGFLFLDAKNMELVEYYKEKLGAQWIGGPHQYRMLVDERAAWDLLNKYTLEAN